MVLQIEKIQPSTRYNKRFMATISDGSIIHFGQLLGKTYIDHKDRDKRKNYIARHYANPTEKLLIDNLIPSASLLSMFILWGMYDNIADNLEYLNKELTKKK